MTQLETGGSFLGVYISIYGTLCGVWERAVDNEVAADLGEFRTTRRGGKAPHSIHHRRPIRRMEEQD